jgi:hypothetical protein
MKLFFIGLTSFLIASGAHAGFIQEGSITEDALAAIESGEATKAFNFLQDRLGKPHVDKVEFDGQSQSFYWKGPRTGKRT